MAEVIQFNCPVCGTMLRLPLSMAALQGPCPMCQREIIAPDPYRGIGGYEAPALAPVEAEAYPPFAESPPLVPQEPARQTPAAVALAPSVYSEPVIVASPEPQAFTPFQPSKPLQENPASVPTEPSAPPAPLSPASPAASQILPVPVYPKTSRAILILSCVISAIVALLVGLAMGFASGQYFAAGPTIPDPAVNPAPVAPTNIATAIVPQDKQPTVAPPKPNFTPVMLPEPSPEPPSPPAKASAGAEAALKAFLDAPDWAARSVHVLFPERVRSAMEIYSREAPDGPTAYQEISVITSQVEESTGDSIFIFLVHTSEYPNGIPVSVKESPNGWLVDWQTFVEFRDGLFQKFLSGPLDKPGRFHLVVRTPPAARDAASENEHFSSFIVQSPLMDKGQPAFVRKESESFRLIQASTQHGPAFMVVDVVKRQPSAKQTYYEIQSVNSTNWLPVEN